MIRLQRLLVQLSTLERATPSHSTIDPRARIVVTLIYLVVMLSVPIARLSELLLYALFPIVCAADVRIEYRPILRRSLIVVPFAALVGVFNVFYHREAVMAVGGVVITRGWLELVSIIVRAVLSVQALLVLVRTEGFSPFCNALQRLRVPAPLTTQLAMMYRYMFVLVEQLLSLTRARAARSYGRRAMPVGEWGTIVGQLTLRTFDRAERISMAMAARGFEGRLPDYALSARRWQWRDSIYIVAWSAALIVCRTTYPVERFARFFNSL